MSEPLPESCYALLERIEASRCCQLEVCEFVRIDGDEAVIDGSLIVCGLRGLICFGACKRGWLGDDWKRYRLTDQRSWHYVFEEVPDGLFDDAPNARDPGDCSDYAGMFPTASPEGVIMMLTNEGKAALAIRRLRKSKPRRTSQRRKRAPRTVLTELEKKAWLAYQRLGSYTAVGKELGITRQGATKLVQSASELVDSKGRSAQARQSIPTDARGQETVIDRK